MQVRLNKFLSECGVASRRKADEYIDQARVTVNGEIILDLGHKIDPDKDKIQVDGENVVAEKKVYYLLYKPRGCVTTTNDDKNRKTVIDLIRETKSIFPIGRLDYNTTGVLLLTNDGEFANLLTHPKNNISRVYTATLNKPLEEKDKIRLLSGLNLDKRKSKFEKISFPKPDNYKVVSITVTEGRNHFVKRMFESAGYFVRKLHRSEYAGFNVEALAPSEYIKISKDEIDWTIKKLGKKK